jgi:phage repressor protein C with HTH and peptisase S24 domain
MGHPRFWNPYGAPTVNSANGSLNKLSHGASPAEVVDDFVCPSVHVPTYDAKFRLSQHKSSDVCRCDNRIGRQYGLMDSAEIKDRLRQLSRTQAQMAEFLGIAPNKITKSLNGERRFTVQEMDKIREFLSEEHIGNTPDLPFTEITREYLAVDVLPSYAGMGGGGSGEGDSQTGLVSRQLIEQELRAKVSDLLLIEARGESMMPDFMHGDQILIDRRDCNPVQPGSFALWDGDGYVIKLVERVPHKIGWYRIFSANNRYSAYEVECEQIKIMGRPVWFARRL